MNEIIKLIGETRTLDEYGDTNITESYKIVLANIKSVGMKEHYQSLLVGLKAEYTFEIADYLDYNGQEYIEYNNVRYKVERTYRTGQMLEIVVVKDGKS